MWRKCRDRQVVDRERHASRVSAWMLVGCVLVGAAGCTSNQVLDAARSADDAGDADVIDAGGAEVLDIADALDGSADSSIDAETGAQDSVDSNAEASPCPPGTDFLNDPHNCGGCGIVCCSGNMCQIGMCTILGCTPDGRCPVDGESCSGMFCADLLDDSSNCGACGSVCSPGTTCMNGMCH
jgi:hypothetical protein